MKITITRQKALKVHYSVGLIDEKKKHDRGYVKTLNQIFVYLIGRNIPIIVISMSDVEIYMTNRRKEILIFGDQSDGRVS